MDRGPAGIFRYDKPIEAAPIRPVAEWRYKFNPIRATREDQTLFAGSGRLKRRPSLFDLPAQELSNGAGGRGFVDAVTQLPSSSSSTDGTAEIDPNQSHERQGHEHL